MKIVTYNVQHGVGRDGRFDSGNEVFGQRTRAKDGLEAITKTGVLEENFLGHHEAPG